MVQDASLDASAAALARRGTPLTSDDVMILHGGVRAAALVPGPDGHCFLVEEAKPVRLNEARQLRM